MDRMVERLTDLLTRLLHLSRQDAESYERATTHEEVVKAMTDCQVGNASVLEGLRYELYKSMPRAFTAECLQELTSEWVYSPICIPWINDNSPKRA